MLMPLLVGQSMYGKLELSGYKERPTLLKALGAKVGREQRASKSLFTNMNYGRHVAQYIYDERQFK